MKTETKKIVNYALGAIFLALALAFILTGPGAGKNSSAYSAGHLLVTEDNFDFGNIAMSEGNVSHVFGLRNESEESVVIEKAYTSCMCTIAYIADNAGKKAGPFGMPGHGGLSGASVEVAPGDNVKVEAIFDPAAHGPAGVGLAQRSVYLETNSAQSPRLELKFTATVTR